MSTATDERTLHSELRGHNDAIKRLEGEKATAMTAAETLLAAEIAAGRDPQDPSGESFAKMDAAYAAADTLGEQASQHRQQADRLLRMLGDKSGASTGRSDSDFEARAVEAIMGSPEYKRLLETGAFSAQGGRIELPGIELASARRIVENVKQGLPIFSATADVGDFIAPDERRFPPVPIPVRQLRLLDLITLSTTGSDKVNYVEEVLRTDAAAETELGVAYPEASYAYELRSADVEDIGHFTPAHRSNLADEGQLQGLLEGRLETGVELRWEKQMVQGNGLDGNLLGILNTDNIGHVERNGTASERIIEVIHRGITTIRLSLEGEPDAIGIHPTSYEAAIFEKDENKNYLLGPSAQATSRTIWGFPVVVSTVFPANTALVGNYKTGAISWVRSGVAVRASDSHEDFFTRRMVALLAEMRAAFAAWQPRAFCEADLT